jgi:hypothetical protein
VNRFSSQNAYTGDPLRMDPPPIPYWYGDLDSKLVAADMLALVKLLVDDAEYKKVDARAVKYNGREKYDFLKNLLPGLVQRALRKRT